MKINLRLKGILSASMGFKEKTFETNDCITVNEFVDSLHLPVDTSWVLISVNDTLAEKNRQLKENDEILVCPLGGGG